jgi:hypothetical protein
MGMVLKEPRQSSKSQLIIMPVNAIHPGEHLAEELKELGPSAGQPAMNRL